MTPSKEILSKLSRLEAVERRWLTTVFAALILCIIILALTLGGLDIAGMMRGQPIQIAPTQFLIIIFATAIILAANLTVIIDYFAFELRIERAVTIKKRKHRDSAEIEDYEQDEKEQ